MASFAKIFKALLADIIDDEQAKFWENDPRLVSSIKIPGSLAKCLDPNNPECDDWEQALIFEITRLIEMGVFEPATITREVKHIATRWVPQLSANKDGTVKKFKMRYVGKGFTKTGIDFDVNSCSAPVARDVWQSDYFNSGTKGILLRLR